MNYAQLLLQVWTAVVNATRQKGKQLSHQLQELIHRSSHIAFYSGANAERYRIIRILNEESGHIGKTHYEGIDCSFCKLVEKINGDEDES
jgi:hypothetical protein